MSNGDEEISREAPVEFQRSGADEFGRAVSKVAVAQICQSVGFQGFKESALDALADITIRYLRDQGKAARFNANLAGRTECNLFDVIQGLEDLKFTQGFPAGSSGGSCLVSSGIMKEVTEFVWSSDEIPYAQPLPRFPTIRSRRLIPSFVQMSETPPGKHIPTWLPAFPDPHTYVHTPMWNERATDPRADKIEQARQRRKAERALLSLQQRLVSSNDVVGTSVSEDSENDGKESGTVESSSSFVNFLEKDDFAPANNANGAVGQSHLSVLEAFAPAIEAVKDGINDEGDVEKKLLSERRPSVNFKVKTSKKIFGEPFSLYHQKKGGGRMVTRLGRDEERDEKKRRAEHILRQSMENPQELTQL
ncbi:transcription initiation factor TFIID subunit 8 [Tripterygium wilfordii]|uniref:Transcription initiation factor TFIID subunit 8 n=1 Tax=Tripterygium wilfordii TaxID=458696 RepID=A0A7J7DVL3_TRIWF|nr:transcription initiation factor TFIID subunit 8 [Tripterygium wilfordii]KAF5750412.1 transcription initiation factor TFIID subunit 8 [Tripterygium wilfordii]